MNNNKLKSLINYYGGNDESYVYTSSLLNKYTNVKNINKIKIDNLETLLFDDNLVSENNKIIKIDNLNNQNSTVESESFNDLISKLIKL